MFNPDYSSSSPEGRKEEKPERKRYSMKRVQKADEGGKPSASDIAQRPSKEYLEEGSENIFRTYTCPKCRRCFKMHSHLQEHLLLHFPDPTLQCPTCKRYFTSKSKLRIHRLREAGEKVHRCHLCEYSAVERNAIRRHLVNMHTEDAEDGHSYPCPTCGQNFLQTRLLKAHMKTHNIRSDSKPLPCFQEGCSFQSSSRKDLLRHIEEVHGVQAFECRHHACGAIFQSETDMDAHYRTHLAYHCSQCEFCCSNKSAFLQHQRNGHPGSDNLCCDFCSFITFNPVEFEQHIEHLHANEKIHRCSQCSYMTSHKRGLKRHLLTHSGEKPHKCSLCEFRCRDESYLSKHMLTHSEDKNFMCAECGYVTKWKHYLNVHMRKHAGDLRYQCNQCPYRSHRMDQLNSHKLRHQAKSLMCEICAYACKRKYELRNHMLKKHSVEDKQPSVYKCNYCTYSTCYRQALQNHENCKHTKLKEFRCALCFYFSFSSISLFLHKRKAHGYVPGDKAWQENYASKEMERNSTESLQKFYNKPSTSHEHHLQRTSEEPLPSQRKQLDHLDSVDSSKVAVMDDFDVVSQEVANEGVSDSPSSMNSPEYCTLVLTTLSNSDYSAPAMENEEENFADQTRRNLISNGTDILQEKALFSTSSSEEDDVPAADAECEQRHAELLSTTIQPAAPVGCPTTEGENYSGTTSSTMHSVGNQPLESDIHLKAMKKHDKDQAEVMVLEGRVHMLVVPTRDTLRCEKCSYVTSRETTLKYHCQALCLGRIKVHKCQACGAQFKQKRGLNSHCAKKCPALQRKIRTFVGNSNICLPKEDRSTVGQGGSKQPDKGTNFDQTGLWHSQSGIGTNLNDQEFQQQEAEVCASHSANCKVFGNNALGSNKSECKQNKTQIKDQLEIAQKQLLSDNELIDVQLEKKDGKFKCRLCNFSSVKIATVERHLTTCRKISNRTENQMVSPKDDGCGGKSVKAKGDSMEPDRVSCTMCSFLSESKMSLTRHRLYVHKRKKLGVARHKHLHCQHCTFTCKQERCMAQHIALKHKGTRPLRCHYCPFSTSRQYRLEQHESLHTGIGRHSCDICEKTFGAVTKLRQHKVRIHDKQPTHFCSLCDFRGYTVNDVRRHNLRCHTGELNHGCTRCDAQFSSEVALRNHCKRVHQLKVFFSCKQCDYTCSSEVKLKTHQENKHTRLKCTSCQEPFKTKESLAIHQRTHLAHHCQLCPFATKTRQLLAQHLLNEHEEGSPDDKPLKCSTCHFACRHQLVFEQHLRSHGGKRLYKCTDCKYSTRNKQKITWHIRIHTGERPYSCEQCTYTCTDPSRLKIHMRVHREEKKYLCPQCGYKCKWATQLKYHMTKHTGEKPHACEECDYRTNRADALRAHRDTQHCEMRPYVCEKCGKAFKTNFILKTHQRQHSDNRPYVCGLCSKDFRWPAGLRHHYLSHTRQQPFSCRHCSYRAKQRFQVVKHLQRHHPEMSVEQGVVRDSEAPGLTLKEALTGVLNKRVADLEQKEIVTMGVDSKTKVSQKETLNNIT